METRREERHEAEAIREAGAIGILRIRERRALLNTVEALRDGGLRCIEITMNTPGVLEALEQATQRFPDLVLGAGTVLDAKDAEAAMSAGARFLVTPVVAPDVIRAGRDRGCAVVCGAMTPTEIYTSWQQGADIVKVFPAEVLGIAFVRALRGPLPQIPLAPTGGITAENAGAYLQAGVVAVCAGGWLVNERSVAAEEYAEIRGRARALCQAVSQARAPRVPS